MRLKVLSWNIWTDGYFGQVTSFLKASEADIIGLQEVLPDDPRRDVIRFLNKLGYQHVFVPVKKTFSNKIRNDGPAIFSKYKISKSETYILSTKNPRAAVNADILVGDETLHVFSTHLIHTHQQPSKEQEEQGLNLLKVMPARRAIVMGDFNATPESSVIKYMRKALIDSDPSPLSTWSVYPQGCEVCNPQEINTKLDYIFTSKDIKISSFKVEKSKGSDHLPISVILDI